MNLNHQKLESLFEIVDMLCQQNNFQEILRLLSTKACTLFNAKNASILMINPKTHETIKTVIKEGDETTHKRYHVLHINVAGWILKYNQPFLSPDIKKDTRFPKGLFKNTNVYSVMGNFIKLGDSIIGYFLVMNKTSKVSYNSEDLSLFNKLINLAAPFLSNVQKIQEYFQIPLPDNILSDKYKQYGLLGKSKSFIELLKSIDAAARCDVRVLLEGPSGTGKELIARAIHQLSSRKNGPFIAIDCGAIPENLMESEFFGHKKGAFTGAVDDQKGLLSEAHLGTLIMDEITNLPLDMQAKLLRVLQENEIRPVGSTQSSRVDVRIIAASSVPLTKLVEVKKFREDLFYRLHVYPIYVPTLNDRKDDIPILVNHFIKKFAQEQNKQCSHFHETLLRFIKQRNWPGNIRELENFVERLVILSPADLIEVNHDILPPDIKKEFKKTCGEDIEYSIQKSLNEILSDNEEKIIRQVLKDNGWNQSKTARILKVSEQTIRYKMAKYGIVKPD